MIVTEGQLRLLRKGATLTVTIPADPAPFARPRPPVTIGRSYGAQLAPFTRSKLRVIAAAVQLDGDTWRVTIHAGDVEQPRFLKARPGGLEGDYTSNVSKAARDEPEPVDEATLTRFEKDARSAERVRSDYETRKACRRLEDAIGDLAARRDLGESAAKRLANMRRELVRLERELRAA